MAEIGIQGILEALIPNPDLDFLNSNLEIHFWANLGRKSQNVRMSENWHTWYLGRVDSESGVRFSKCQPQNPFLGKFGQKKHSLIGDPAAVFGYKASFGFIF